MQSDAFSMKRLRRGTSPLAQVHSTEAQAPAANAFQSETEFDEVHEIAIPTEIPQPPNLSRLPAEVLHSGTVETLIAHNEDLISRLKVNLRRNAILEQNIIGLEKQLGEMRQLNETLEDQVYIIRERDRLNREKTNSHDDRIEKLEEMLELAKIQVQEAQEQSDYDRRRIIAYNRRIRRWVRPGFKRAMNRINKDEMQAREIGHQANLIRRDLASRDIEVAELTRQVSELRTFQRERERNFQKDQTVLTESFEKQIAAIRKDYNDVSMQLSYFRERAALLDEVTKRAADFENRSILFERKSQELEEENTKIRGEGEEQRREAFRLGTQVEILRDEMRRAREETERIEGEFERTQEQLSSLQVLWNQNRKDTEAMQLRIDALTQINQELSRKMNQTRISGEIEALELGNTKSLANKTLAFEKIENLLSTIETGMPASRIAKTVGQLEGLDFIEGKIESGHAPLENEI